MDLRTLLIIFSCLVTWSSLGYFGIKFLKKKNLLLGIEWMVLSLSSLNFALYWATKSSTSWDVMIYFDAFSRIAGMTIVTMMGMMVVSHGFKPSIRTDFLAFGVTGLATALVLYVLSEQIGTSLRYIYLISWYIFAIYLVYFTIRLFAAGETTIAVHMIIAMLLLNVLHTAYDFYQIPGDAENLVLNFYFLAMLVWAYGYSVIYFAYTALERAQQAREQLI